MKVYMKIILLKFQPFGKITNSMKNGQIYSKLNKKALDVLCRSGALDSLIDERFNGCKHFWTACVQQRPKTLKKLEENIKAQQRGEAMLRLKKTFSRAQRLQNLADKFAGETDNALRQMEKKNALLQERLTGLMDMVESQSECIRGLEAAATVANARIQELEAQIREGGGRVRERVRSGERVKVRTGATSADAKHDSARGTNGAVGEAGGRRSAPGSPQRTRRKSGSRRRVASSAASSVVSVSSAQTV